MRFPVVDLIFEVSTGGRRTWRVQESESEGESESESEVMMGSEGDE